MWAGGQNLARHKAPLVIHRNLLAQHRHGFALLDLCTADGDGATAHGNIADQQRILAPAHQRFAAGLVQVIERAGTRGDIQRLGRSFIETALVVVHTQHIHVLVMPVHRHRPRSGRLPLQRQHRQGFAVSGLTLAEDTHFRLGNPACVVAPSSELRLLTPKR